jgi:hypothetical protein
MTVVIEFGESAKIRCCWVERSLICIQLKHADEFGSSACVQFSHELSA